MLWLRHVRFHQLFLARVLPGQGQGGRIMGHTLISDLFFPIVYKFHYLSASLIL